MSFAECLNYSNITIQSYIISDIMTRVVKQCSCAYNEIDTKSTICTTTVVCVLPCTNKKKYEQQ